MLSHVSALLLFSINIWTHGSVLTRWKDRAFPRLFQFYKFMTADNCWGRDTQISTSNPGKLWITSLSIAVQEQVISKCCSTFTQSTLTRVWEKNRDKEERGEAAKAIFMIVWTYKGNQSPAWQQLARVFIQFYMPFLCPQKLICSRD